MSNEEVVLYTGFEGAEKKIEVCFRPDASQPNGLRSVLPQMWQSSILDMIHCTIIGATNNAHFDSYVLSESSLFVYPYKVILKTCGTTTLLHAIQPLIELAKTQCNLVPDSVFFSRKNFKFPERQLSPHTSLEEEVRHEISIGQCMIFNFRSTKAIPKRAAVDGRGCSHI
jgi:S-adenosylmethionine decarboxylase